jgi:hypothetical protein
VLGGAVEAPSVRMHIPLTSVYDRDRMGVADEADLAEVKDLATPGLPIHREARLRVELKEDGTVKIVLARGKADEKTKSMLGSHKLFTPK